jgi:phenylacetate-CoA ligase
MTSGDWLSGSVRTELEHLLGAPVYDFYTAGEVGVVGFECAERDGFHVETRRLVVELGKDGAVIATTLDNDAMPLIRYALGDRGTWIKRACTCGDSRPRLRLVGDRIKRPIHDILDETFGDAVQPHSV